MNTPASLLSMRYGCGTDGRSRSKQIDGLTAQQGSQDLQWAAVRDDSAILAIPAEIGKKAADTLDQRVTRLAAGRREIRRGCRPFIQGSSWDAIPGSAFPFAEIEFRQSLIQDKFNRQMPNDCAGEFATPTGRAAPYTSGALQDRIRGALRKFMLCVRCQPDIQAAVAYAGGDIRRRVTEQKDFHFICNGKPATMNVT